MKNLMSKFVAVTTLSLVATFSQATLIETTVDIVHNYGDTYTPTSIANGNNPCDSLTSNAVHINDDSAGTNCGRFYDYFDFSAFDFESVDYFSLSLTFSDVNDDARYWLFFNDREDWNVRVGASASSSNNGYGYSYDKNIENGTFIYNENTMDSAVFQRMVTDQNFTLMFSEESNSFGLADDFYLSSATLSITGQTTQVPEPAPLALFSVSLIALGLMRKRQK
ncbi:PEP-CTERM sorting domain-containing protein [Thalassotalea profundi]|uniref:PEP-CTERM sorting domain-containing protein n=1 Tax=Thalassotalea profundi TaxID=2036687 RepID=A0ABQ3IS75_9GAMM|nr:PEP-CTERM sorting domain-containing protein [Thalassotalea profundi]GHE92158.1 hypothetical protein GCM10011501_22110 [Thalassotalea profundi]